MKAKISFIIAFSVIVCMSSIVHSESAFNEAFRKSYDTNMQYNRESQMMDNYNYNQLNAKQKRILDRTRSLYYLVANIVRPQIDPLYMNCLTGNKFNEYMAIQCFKQNMADFTTPSQIRKMMKSVGASDDEYRYIEYFMNGWYNLPGRGPRYPSAADAMSIK